MREKMGDDKKFKKEREKRKGKNKKLQKEEMAWLTENTRFDKSNINAWHKVRRKDRRTHQYYKSIIDAWHKLRRQLQENFPSLCFCTAILDPSTIQYPII